MNSPYYNSGLASGRKAAVKNQPVPKFHHPTFASPETQENHKQFLEGFNAGYMLEKLGIEPNELLHIYRHSHTGAYLATICKTCFHDKEGIVTYLCATHDYNGTDVLYSATSHKTTKSSCHKCGFSNITEL